MALDSLSELTAAITTAGFLADIRDTGRFGPAVHCRHSADIEKSCLPAFWIAQHRSQRFLLTHLYDVFAVPPNLSAAAIAIEWLESGEKSARPPKGFVESHRLKVIQFGEFEQSF